MKETKASLMKPLLHKATGHLLSAALCLLAGISMSSCITEEVYPSTIDGNVEALWEMLDEHYCFFDYKNAEYGLDWNEVHERYREKARHVKDAYELFDLLAEMTYELRDGHVNISAPHNVSRYGAWFDDFPANFSDSLQRAYLGKSNEYKSVNGLTYRVLPGDSIAYLRCGSFSAGFGEGNLHEVMRAFKDCPALIVDIRNNGGGLLTGAERLASVFISEKTIGGYFMHKTGKGHNDFSSPEAIEIEPSSGRLWQKPVAVLTNRSCYSAANSFVMFVKGLPQVTIIGDRTGGGSGMPFTSELPTGWDVRFSACPMLNRNFEHTEHGIEPDIKVDIASEDYSKGIDTIIETARKHLLKK